MRVGDKVRSVSDGQLGIVSESETGALMVRLDRPAERREVPYRATDWKLAVEERLTPLQEARIAFAADSELRACRGEYGLPAWIALKDEAKAKLIQGLPGAPDDLRKRIRAAILAELRR